MKIRLMLGRFQILIAVMTVLVSGCPEGGATQMEEARRTNSVQNACSQSQAVIDIGIGWTVDEARERSPELAHISPALANWAPAAYVHKPARVKLEGSIPFEVSCPHMVVITPKNGRVVGVDIDLPPTSDLDVAMKLMGEWHHKFESMKLDPPPSESARYVDTFEEARLVLQKINSLTGVTGDSTGSWRCGSEVVGTGIEKRNVGSLNQPRYIYVVQLSVADVSTWTSR